MNDYHSIVSFINTEQIPTIYDEPCVCMIPTFNKTGHGFSAVYTIQKSFEKSTAWYHQVIISYPFWSKMEVKSDILEKSFIIILTVSKKLNTYSNVENDFFIF